MIFTDIVADICDRMNYTSSDATTRIGKAVNRKYKTVTTTIGMITTRRTEVQANATLGVRTLAFTSIEKVLAVIDKSSGSNRILKEVSFEEIQSQGVGTDDAPAEYAIYRDGSTSVTIYLDCNPQTEFTLYAEGMSTVSTLSGSDVPAFPESFHDVLAEGVLVDEYRKLGPEHQGLMRESARIYETRLSDLRMWMAISKQKDVYQGLRSTGSLGSGSAGGSSGSVTDGASSWTQTGLITFDRDPSAPFAVASGSAKVDNLDADLLDGQTGSYYTTASNLTGALPAISGAALTGLPVPSASDLVAGTVPTARLGSGTASVETFLRGDQVWATGFELVCQGRLTLTTAVPVTTTDVTGATTVYFTPYKGNRLALFNGTNWKLHTFTERSLALGTLTADLPYDVFIYDNAGTITLEFLAWTNGTTRATALASQDGVLSKTGALTRRYLGTFYTTATTTTEDSFAKRFLWNYYNQEDRSMRVLEATDTWVYSTGTIRQARASTANQLAVVIGVAGYPVEVNVYGHASNDTGNVSMSVLIGENSTTAAATGCIINYSNAAVAARFFAMAAALKTYPAIGYSFYAWLERVDTTGVTTWLGDAGAPTYIQSGIHGTIRG